MILVFSTQMKRTLLFSMTGVPIQGMIFESPWGHKQKIAVEAFFVFNLRIQKHNPRRKARENLFHIFVF